MLSGIVESDPLRDQVVRNGGLLVVAKVLKLSVHNWKSQGCPEWEKVVAWTFSLAMVTAEGGDQVLY